MLTYAIVDRGTVRIDGYQDQTGDLALYQNHYYTDKLPGYPLLATLPYVVAKKLMALPDHPVNSKGFAFWLADYVITVFTSGLFTAITGALLVSLAADLGCGPRRSALIGLAYGLATPAYAYASLAYGHQTAGACLIASFWFLRRPARGRFDSSSLLAGFLASFASVIEIQVGPVSAILGLYALAQVLRRERPSSRVVGFALGALLPTILLLVYNTLAFESPLRMGYFFLVTDRYAKVHSAANPLGVGAPDWSRLDDLLIKPARGLFWYAPIVVLTLPGLFVLMFRRFYATAIVATATIAAVMMVTLSYPEWTGGWATGPRLLIPMLPFAMLPVAALLAVGGRVVTGLATLLAVVGGVIILLFQGVGARVPDPHPQAMNRSISFVNPLPDAVLPIWEGARVPDWLYGQRFARNLVSIAQPEWVASLDVGRQWLQFLPLVTFQIVAISLLIMSLKPKLIMPPKSSERVVPRVVEPPPTKPDPV